MGRDVRTVLVVERDAHRRMGHFPTAFASVARGFAALGCTVDVLTQQGWLLGDSPDDGAFSVHRFDRQVARLDRLAVGARSSAYRLARGRFPRSTRALAMADRVSDLSDVCSAALAGVAVRRWARARGTPDLVVVMTYYTTPAVVGAVVRKIPTLVYTFVGPRRRTRRISSRISRVLQRLSTTTDALCIATADRATAALWERELPTVPVGTSRIVGIDVTAERWTSARRVDARRAARACLGLDENEHIALLFGAGHPEQDPAVVERAFASEGLGDVGLVVAGTIADRLERPERLRLVRRGFVPADELDALLDAADVAVLSFLDDHTRDSATVVDAVRHGIPVVVSDRSMAADLVVQYGFGICFEPGDAASLTDAVRSVPRELAEDVVRRAQDELSAAGVARRLLEIAGTAS